MSVFVEAVWAARAAVAGLPSVEADGRWCRTSSSAASRTWSGYGRTITVQARGVGHESWRAFVSTDNGTQPLTQGLASPEQAVEDAQTYMNRVVAQGDLASEVTA